MNNTSPAFSNDGERLLGSFVTALTQKHRHEDFLWNLASAITDLLKLDDFVVYLREGGSLTQAAAVGIKAPDSRQLFDPITIPIGHAIVGDAAQRQVTVHVGDLINVPGYVADHVDGRSELTVPVLFNSEVVAVFDSEGTVVNAFEQWQIDALEVFAAAASASIVLWKEQRDERLKIEQARGLQARALSTFAGTVAHDLNNILAVIELNAEILRQGTDPTDRIQDSLSGAVQKARRLTGRLLSLTTHGPLAPEIIDVAKLLTDAADEIDLLDNISVGLSLDEALPLVLADAVQIPQIITNLVVNAVDAIGDGQGNIVLSAGADAGDPTMLAIEVADNGPGIDAETMKQIFDPYFSTKPNGVGLGLASAYWGALQHGGRLEVCSNPEAGTSFILRLPSHSGRLVESPPEQSPEPPLKILVLEDDELVGQGLLDVLHFCGHRTAWVRRGEDVTPEWIAGVKSDDPFDVALIDMRNELGQDGRYALKSVQAFDPSVRAVAMSGYADDGLGETLQLGFAATLAKPFRLDELARALHEATVSSGRLNEARPEISPLGPADG